MNTDAQSYLSRSPSDVLAKAEKKAKYFSVCEARKTLFTPICVSVDGMVGREVNAFLKRLGVGLGMMVFNSLQTFVCKPSRIL